MILGLLPAAGSGLRRLQETGQHTRLIGHYFTAYAAAFDHVHYFSYLREAFADYCQDASLRQQVTVWPGREGVPYALYSLLLPLERRTVLARCSVLRVFQATGAVPAALARAALGVPYVVTCGYRYADLAAAQRRPLAAMRLRLMETMAMRKAAAVIVTTADLADYVANRVEAARVHLIPNGVDTTLFAPGTPSVPGDPPMIVYVGRLAQEKGVDLLMDAVADLHVPAQLLLLGDGPLRVRLQEQATLRGAPASFLGVVAHEALPDHLRRCRLFVLPSPMEGQPKALMEAMACGVPCIASDCPGNRSLIRDGHNGLLFPPRDPVRLRQRIEMLLGDRELAMRLGREARLTIVREYDLSVLLEREVDLLKHVGTQRAGD